MTKKLNVTCPHCHSALKIDTEAGVVVDHTPPARPTQKADFNTRLQELEKEKDRAADVMAEAMRKEKSKDRLMEDRFRELLDNAKKNDDGSRPIKDIDLD
jgi:glutaredoxin